MKIGALSLFNNNIASWHWKWSLTWRWVLHIRKHNNQCKLGLYNISTHNGGGIICGLNTQLVDIGFQSQPNMKHHNIS